MHWREVFDMLCDSQMLLRRAVNVMEMSYEAARRGEGTNILLCLEFDELLNSLEEILEIYSTSKHENLNLCAKIHFFLFNIRESISIIYSQTSAWLLNHYTLCKGITYSAIFLYATIERETNRLLRRAGEIE